MDVTSPTTRVLISATQERNVLPLRWASLNQGEPLLISQVNPESETIITSAAADLQTPASVLIPPDLPIHPPCSWQLFTWK